MKKLRVVQIGAEHDHASQIIHSLRKQSDLFDVAGYVIPHDEPTAHFESTLGSYEGLRRMTVKEAFADPTMEGAVIETSEKNLTKYAHLAAQRGLSLHMDKPGGDTAGDFDALIACLKAKNLVFSTGYMYRHNPAVQALLEMIRKGELGEILHVEAQMNCRHPADKRAWLNQYRGGMMFFLGCHLVDLIYSIQGEPEEILPMNCASGLDGVSAEDFGLALFRYSTGISFAKTTAFEWGGFMRRQLVVVGSKATAEINPLEYYLRNGENGADNATDLYITTEKDGARDGWNARGEKRIFGPYDRYDPMMRSYAEAALGGHNNLPSYDYEAKVYHAVMRACNIE